MGFVLIGIITFGQNYLMTNGSATTCSGNFYDSGGAAGEYGNNENFIFTFIPATSGVMLQFHFSSFKTKRGDFLNIYDGLNTSGPLIGKYELNYQNGFSVAANNPDGALTFEFVSDWHNTEFGWHASISCAPSSLTNDVCEDAIAINEVIDLPFSNINATASGKKDCGAKYPIDLWYAYTATMTGDGYFDLCGSYFDTRLAIWEGCDSGSALECTVNSGPICSGQQSSIIMAVTEGVTYYVQVGGKNLETGIGDLTINVFFPGVWTGAISTNWGIANNWHDGTVPDAGTDVTIPATPAGGNFPETNSLAGAVCNDLMIKSGAHLYIPSDNTLTVNGTLSNIAGTAGLIIKADASGMGSLIHTTANIPATVEEYVTSERWHLVSSPVANSTINTYFDIYLKEWDEPTRSWTYLVEPITIPLNVAQGYSAWADNTYTGTTTVDFIGTLNTGDYTSSLDYTLIGGNTEEGFNLVGNPYPSAIDWNTNWNITNLSGWAVIYDNGVYRGWNPYLTGMDRSYNGKLDGIIPSTQGFWLRAIGSGASVTIPASERVHDAQAFYKDSEESTYAGIRLQVSIDEFTDDAVVLLHPEGTAEFDGLYDLSQFENVPEAPQLYSMMSDGNYAVNVISENTEETIIAMGFKTGQPGTYAINTESMSNFNEGMIVYLEDTKLGNRIELEEGTSYEFDYDLLDNEHRFNLHFKDASNDIDENGYSGINIYSFNDQVYIQTPELESAEVVIYDIMGQEVIREQTASNGYSVINITTGTGYYLVKLNTNDRVITEKVFIK